MATGGEARESMKGSDEFYRFLCSPCSRTEIDIGAEVYCIQCGEYLCRKCHGHHDKFTKMKAHAMLDRDQMEATAPQPAQPLLTGPRAAQPLLTGPQAAKPLLTGPQAAQPLLTGPQAAPPLLTVPCDLHPGQMYTLYCEKHDQVCCAVCFPLYHKSCDLKYICDAVKEAMHSPDQTRQAMQDILKHLEKVKRLRETDMERIEQEKATEIDKIHVNTQQMLKDLEGMEDIAVDYVTKKFTEFKANIENDLAKLDNLMSTVNTKINKLDNANHEIDRFVHMKICEVDTSSARNLIEDIEARVGEEKLVFLIDDRVEESIKKLRSLGQLVLDYRYAVTPGGQHRVDTQEDDKDCNITEACFAQDGTLLLADGDNKCLKRLDESYRIMDRLKFNDHPTHVCSVSANQVAVCLFLSKEVQMVRIDQVMSRKGSFKTTDRCRAIAHHDDRLYVACGGNTEKGEEPGHIAIYSISGKLVRKLKTDHEDHPNYTIPLAVAVRSSDGAILVRDVFGLTAFREDGQLLWVLMSSDLEEDRALGSVSMDSHGQALVSCRASNTVILVSMDGRNLGVVLSTRDGIRKPQALCFNTKQSRLTVGMANNNRVRVYNFA